MPLLTLIGGLILYGSLYPFNFTAPAPEALDRFLSTWQLFTTRGDLLGNIGLFVPWGLVGVVALSKGRSLLRAGVLTFLAGLFVAFLAQVLQIWVPSRDAALADVFWNCVGIGLGMLPAQYLTRQLNKSPSQAVAWMVPAAILGALVLAQWLPLIPSLDLQLVKDQVKSLLSAPSISIGTVALQTGTAVLAGYLIAELQGKRSSVALLGLLVVTLTVGKFFLHGVHVDLSAPIGMVIGTGAWWWLTKTPSSKRDVMVWLALISAYTLSALSPFSFQSEPTAVSWVPFAALLEGSMLANVRAILGNLVLFSGMLFIGSKSAGKAMPLGFALAVWVFLLELLQTVLVGRTSDITEPLLIFLMAYLLDSVQRANTLQGNFKSRAATSAHTACKPKKPQHIDAPSPSASGPNRLAVLMQVAFVALVIIGAITVVLRIPGIPYNVTELFRGNGSFIYLAFFALAVLWAGAGSVWLSRRLIVARWPGLALLPLTLIVSMTSLVLLWAGVTTESINDISGSPTIFRAVTNGEAWGLAWKTFFLSFNSAGTVNLLEHIVTYSALYSPLPVALALSITVWRAPRLWQKSPVKGLGLIVSAILLIWLCKTFAVDWATTDNLTELIAHEGAWGVSGVSYLYALLVLICLNALLVVKSVEAKGRWIGLGILACVVAVPLGWWLLNQGIDPAVEKYGQIFSGVQFLLGQDRNQIISIDTLFLRWCFVQVAGVTTLATGVILGNKWCNASAVAPKRAKA